MDHSDSERGNPLPPLGLLFPINSNGSFICTIPQTGYPIHTTAFVASVVEHWLEREIAQWVHSIEDRSDDPSHHERTLLPESYISLHWGRSLRVDKSGQCPETSNQNDTIGLGRGGGGSPHRSLSTGPRGSCYACETELIGFSDLRVLFQLSARDCVTAVYYTRTLKQSPPPPPLPPVWWTVVSSTQHGFRVTFAPEDGGLLSWGFRVNLEAAEQLRPVKTKLLTDEEYKKAQV